jgi:cation diffusion facilitator CzcD-associated flavoprotein CzcO
MKGGSMKTRKLKKFTTGICTAALAMTTLFATAPFTGMTAMAAISEQEIAEIQSPVRDSLETSWSVLKFGTWQGEDISWRVLSRDGDQVLLLADRNLDIRKFDNTETGWENSSIKAWLNGEFYNQAFANEAQKAAIIDSDYGKVYLPSLDETQNFLPVQVSQLIHSSSGHNHQQSHDQTNRL